MRRKLCTAILAAVLALSVCSTGALAVQPRYPGHLGHCNVYSKSVCADVNGDGICDAHGAGCRRYVSNVRRHHLCWRPGTSLCHFTSGGCWVNCVDADCNGLCDTCGAAVPVKTPVGNAGSASGSAGNGGNSYGSSGSAGTGGNSYGSGSYGYGNYGYGNYGCGNYGGGYCGSSGHHSGHHGGHC